VDLLKYFARLLSIEKYIIISERHRFLGLEDVTAPPANEAHHMRAWLHELVVRGGPSTDEAVDGYSVDPSGVHGGSQGVSSYFKVVR
jgi:hypothetical protein